MSAIGAELGQRVRLSDPKPFACSGCFRGAEDGVKFVDFDAALDRGQFIREVDGAVLLRESLDDLHLCEACLREACEVLELDAERDAKQRLEIRRLQTVADHWLAYAKRLEATLHERPEKPIVSARQAAARARGREQRERKS